MKLLYTLFFSLLLFIPLTMEAQEVDFAPVGAKWWINQIVTEPAPPRDSFIIAEVTGEEMKAGELCRVIENVGGCRLPDPTHVFTRNDSVFFYSEVTQQFELLYDFTAGIGSKWTIRGLGGGAPDQEVEIIDVGFEVVDGDTLKTWTIPPPVNTSWGRTIYEHIGNSTYLSPHYPNSCGDLHEPSGVRCYSDSNRMINFNEDDCEVVYGFSSTESFPANVDLQVHPNPASSRLELSISGLTDYSRILLFLYNQHGQLISEKVYQQSHPIIDVSPLPPGLYYLTVKGDGEWLGRSKFAVHR